jgi:CheY-like chemotaxis protein
LGKIRVVLADDNQQMIAMVRQTLGEQFEVVGVVGDGKDAAFIQIAFSSPPY